MMSFFIVSSKDKHNHRMLVINRMFYRQHYYFFLRSRIFIFNCSWSLYLISFVMMLIEALVERILLVKYGRDY